MITLPSRWLRAVPCLLLVAACGSGDKPAGDAPTWYRDASPILEARCTGCHTAGGIAPFSLHDYADALDQKPVLKEVLEQGLMPPWPPDAACNQYENDRSLPKAEKDVLLDWLARGAPKGDPRSTPRAVESHQQGLSRVDAELSMAAPYQPVQSPDEYRCFLLDWNETTTKFVSGFSATPGNPAMVHHVIAFLISPSQVPTYQQLDAADAAPGWPCFGGPGGGLVGMLGAWVPGTLGTDFPQGTGVKVVPGSKVVLQVHYNTLAHAQGADQTRVAVKLDDTVQREAAILPWANPSWLNGAMSIPAGASDVVHAFTADPTPYMARITSDVVASNQPFAIWSAALHLHLRGTSASLKLQKKGGGEQCLLDIPRWDFHWQGGYGLKQPVIVYPGDQLSVTCHWDNSAGNQPVVDGHQLPPQDLNWGEGTTDEMCLGFFYVTQWG